LKKLEIEKKTKEIEAFKKKLADKESKKAQDIKDKLAKIKDQGGLIMASGNETKESMIEKAVRL